MNKFKINLLILSFIALYGCENNNNIIYNKINFFLSESFDIKSTEPNNVYIFINSKGCHDCIYKAFQYYSDSVKNNKNYYFVISNTAYKRLLYSPKLSERLLVDLDDKMEYNELNISGVSIFTVIKKDEILQNDFNINSIK